MAGQPRPIRRIRPITSAGMRSRSWRVILMRTECRTPVSRTTSRRGSWIPAAPLPIPACAGSPAATKTAGQQFRLQLTSFGADPACSSAPGVLAQDCPAIDIAEILAASTGGQVLPEGSGTPSPFASGNNYVDWTVWRGAAYPALNRLGELLVWRDYNEAESLGLDNFHGGVLRHPARRLDRPIGITAGSALRRHAGRFGAVDHRY